MSVDLTLVTTSEHGVFICMYCYVSVRCIVMYLIVVLLCVTSMSVCISLCTYQSRFHGLSSRLKTSDCSHGQLQEQDHSPPSMFISVIINIFYY